jgi:LDH2 family malate/lactate/ureidoglycolate dehydrogenase
MATGDVRVGWRDLTAFTAALFERVGLPPDDAAIEAEVLVWANLRGVDSHGVLRIPWYVELTDKGDMNPRPRIRIERETPATLLIDADRAYGPVVTTMAMRRAIDKARAVGIGWAVIRNTTHQGAMAYYALMAAREGQAGLAIVCSPPNMAPHGARAAGVHNSPIAIAVPGRRHRHLVLDMATSVAAGGKLRLAIDKDVPIPVGWALDAEGRPTTDARQAVILLPAGGPKGSGLAMMFETLTSLVAGNPLLQPALTGADGARRHRQNSVVAAVDLATFTDVEAYRDHVDGLVESIKALPRAEPGSEVLVPGEPEDRCAIERARDGIPLPPGTVRGLRAVAARFDVKLPASLEGKEGA